jgi:hypothetical protein
MFFHPVLHIIRRATSLLRRDGTSAVKQEYYYWVDWLRNEMKGFDQLPDADQAKIMGLFEKAPDLMMDVLPQKKAATPKKKKA